MSNGINMGFLNDPQAVMSSGYTPGAIAAPVSSGGYSNPIGINVGSLPSMAPTGTINNVLAGGPAGTGSGVGGALSGLFDTLTGSNLVQTGLSAAALQDQMNRLSDIGTGLATGARELGEEAQAGTAFRPFTVSTGFGGVQATPTGGYTTTLSPAMAAQQQALQGITSGLLGGMGGMSTEFANLTPERLQQAEKQRQRYLEERGGEDTLNLAGDIYNFVARQPGDSGYVTSGPAPLPLMKPIRPSLTPEEAMAARSLGAQPPQAPMAPTAPATGGFGAGIPDVSGIQRQALGGVGGFLTGAMAPMAQREADVYERIRATQRPEEQRQQLALEERLASQGRTGLRTAQFGGSPEQFALAQAQEEAKARASLGALGQAQAEQLQQMGLAESMFGLGGRAAALPQSLQAGQLGNIQAAMGLQYMPEQQLLGTLTPAISIADIAGTGQRQGAGYLAQAGTTGLEALGQTELARANLLRDLYSGLLAQQTSAQTGERQESIAGGLFGDLISGIGGIFGIGN